jgi:hypothetical protein
MFNLELPSKYNDTYFAEVAACEFDNWCKEHCTGIYLFQDSLHIGFEKKSDLQSFKKKFIGDN